MRQHKPNEMGMLIGQAVTPTTTGQLINYLVDAHLCKRFDEPNKRRLCRRSRLRGVGNEALRRFDTRGYKILSFGLPPHITSARFV